MGGEDRHLRTFTTRVRSDLIRAVKHQAVEDHVPVQKIVEEALEQWLRQCR